MPAQLFFPLWTYTFGNQQVETLSSAFQCIVFFPKALPTEKNGGSNWTVQEFGQESEPSGEKDIRFYLTSILHVHLLNLDFVSLMNFTTTP